MKIGFAAYLSEGVTKKFAFLPDLEDEINRSLNTSNYGDEVIEIFIGIICVSPEYEPFHKIRKPRYTRTKRIYVSDEGEKIELSNYFCYDIRLNYAQARNVSDSELKSYVMSEISNSIDLLKRFKHFEFVLFKTNLENGLKKYQLSV